MRAYILKSESQIEPFGEQPCDCLIANRTLAATQTRSLASLGIEPVRIADAELINDPHEHIVFRDNLYFTPSLLEDFIITSRLRRARTTCALKNSLATLRSVTATQNLKICADHIEYDLHYYPEGNNRQQWQPAIIDMDFADAGVPMPPQICRGSRYAVPLTEKAVIQIDHWVNLWAANIASLLQRVAKLQKMPKIKAALLALKARSLNQWKILSRLNTIGARCDIHPTAYIEGSTIADNVNIGAGAVVRGSVIGHGAFIDNGVIVEHSIIGEKSTILDGRIMYSVLYPGVSASTHRIITSLIGRDALIGADVTLTNFRLDGKNITVIKDGEKIDTTNKFIGSCLGHRVYLGAGCIVAPGRAIPSDTRIAPDQSRVITSCDPAKKIAGYRFVTEQKAETL